MGLGETREWARPTAAAPVSETAQRAAALARMARVYLDDGNPSAAEEAVRQGLEVDNSCVALKRMRLEVRAALADHDELESAGELLPEPEPEPGDADVLVRQLTLVGAENLRRTDLLGGADPYASVHFEGSKVGQTEVQFKTLEPAWGSSESGKFTLRVPRERGGRLRVQVWDHDDKTAHDFLGQVEFVLGGATGQGGVDAVVPLNSYQLLARKGFVGKDRVKGRLSLTVTEDDLYNKLRSFFYEIDEDGSVVAALLSTPATIRCLNSPLALPLWRSSGTLDAEEVSVMAERLGKPLTKAQLAEAMGEMDHDGSGSVDFEEFEQCASLPADLVMHQHGARQGR
jgi:hypothetical protein